MSVPTYAHPPIAEAVVELRTVPITDAAPLAKAKGRLGETFPRQEDQVEMSVIAEAGKPNVQVQQQLVGHTLRSEDGADVVHVRKNGIAVIRLAPYSGWKQLMEVVSLGRREWRRVVPTPRFQRFGVRCLNRLDIPNTSPPTGFEETDYLRVGTPRMPFPTGAFDVFKTMVQGHFPDSEYGYVIQTGVAPSPLIDHTALILDVDIFLKVDGPMSDADIDARLDAMRDLRNMAFEASITDKARELFNG